ncbi:MAG: DnaJ domain-containing protein [Paludibacteraceae bacterium]|nr:DnaJ domain-containing protein [Paludibacteraceae bacterium]
MSIFINELSNRHYEKKWGMTEIEIKDYMSRRGSLGDKPNRYVLPYVSRLCRLNGEGRQSQEAFLSDWFSEDEIAHVFATDYTDPQIEELNRRWRKESLSCRKSLMELLFKLAIVQDGIHNDEWNMLMSLMTQLKFNKNYFDFFKKRYSSLRTEFDEYEYKRSASTEDHSVSNLKPYFELLGLDENATDEEIKRAYHNLALLHHPDLPKNSARIEECETLMTKINEAYEKVRR